TAQALLANMAAMYACHEGQEGLRRIAQRIHSLTSVLAKGLEAAGFQVGQRVGPADASTIPPVKLPYFDTLRVEIGSKSIDRILKSAEARHLNFRVIDERTLGISLDETTSEADILAILSSFNGERHVDTGALVRV